MKRKVKSKIVKKSKVKTKVKPKKVVKKRTTKKAERIEKVKSFKHKRVTILPAPTNFLPEMVLVSDGPAWVKSLIGKRYISIEKAITQIEALDSERSIQSGKKGIIKELLSVGVTPFEVEIDENE